MRVMLIQPPRRYWPYTSEGDNFLLQQALPALAAVAIQEGHEVEVLDCMPEHVGWKSLYDRVRDFKPHVIGCGENHALYTKEALRFFRLAREAAPEAVTVAGGGHFTNLAERYACHPDIDVICVGEGELTFAEILSHVDGGRHPKNGDWDDIDGIAFARDGVPVRTKPARLIKHLDDLPIPAYDRMPMHLYGTSRYLFSPGGSTLHHSRGCVSKCSFCAWWTTMADRREDKDGNIRLVPRWRSKSVDRMMEEVELLYYKYGKRAYVWVDESWNIDPKFNIGFSEKMIESGMKTKWMTFMRADCIVRDHEKGILEAQVRAGLAHILIGVERAEDDNLTELDKRFYTGGVAERAIAIFKENYPEVFIQATFIVGVKNETQDTLARQVELAHADTVRRLEAHLREMFVLRLCFGVWAKDTRTAQSSKLGSGELLRRCLCAWSAVASQPRASLPAVLVVRQKVHEKLLAVDDDIGHINSRIDQLQSPVDSDTEYHRR